MNKLPKELQSSFEKLKEDFFLLSIQQSEENVGDLMAERKHYYNDDDVKYQRAIEHINDSFLKMEMDDSFEQNQTSNLICQFSSGDSLGKESEKS